MSSTDYQALFATHRDHLWGLCYRVTGNAADAEDLVQETFARALERPPADTSRPWRPWLATVATRLSIDALRRRRTRKYVGPWLPSAVETPPGTTAGELAATQVDAETRYGLRETVSLAFLIALEALTPAQRAALVLRDALGYSGPETAQLLDISPDNARVLLHRARKAMERYDTTRRPPSPQVDAEHQQALQRLMLALATGDEQQIARCVTEDVRVATDGAGRYRAATKVVVGRERVARFFVGLKRHSAEPSVVEPRWLNGQLSIVMCTEPRHPRDAPRACISVEVNADGLVTEFHIINAPEKLTAVQFPERS